MTAQASECVLTPDFARSLIRITTLRTGSALLDEDLAQEALLRGLKAFRRTVHVEHPRAFFSKIVRDTVRDHWRRRRVLLSLESIGQNQCGYVIDFEQQLDRDKQLGQVRDALSRLSPKQQELMEMFYFEELSLGDLSAMLRKSRSALKMALLRGRERIIQAVALDSAVRSIESQKNKKEDT